MGSGINTLHPESGNHLVGTNKPPGVLTDGSWIVEYSHVEEEYNP